VVTRRGEGVTFGEGLRCNDDVAEIPIRSYDSIIYDTYRATFGFWAAQLDIAVKL
jgi:hypothetical protein